MSVSRSRYLLPASLLAAVVAGCGGGPDVASVTGTVNLDGKPLEGAMVVFTPVAGGRSSGGRTDATGHYELIFSEDREGALPGEHLVRVSTFQKGDPDSGKQGVPEKVPPKYNSRSELKKTVKDEANVIDIDLESQPGAVPQPQE